MSDREISENSPSQRDAILGTLLGVAVGDALGLPYENLSRLRGERLFGEPDRYRLIPGIGLISDDTEHNCIVAQSLIAQGTDVDRFLPDFARRLKRWGILLPAGTGRATIIACARLMVGVSPQRSGIFSAGNGPAMRAPILGAAIRDLDQLREFVRVSTRVTHTDPKAEFGAWAIALATNLSWQDQELSPQRFFQRLTETIADEPAEELIDLVAKVIASVEAGESTTDFLDSRDLGKGVSGYVYHTVPAALHVWLSFPNDYRNAVQTMIRCGGDADTTAAIVGGIVGARTGTAGIPPEWIAGLRDWPRTTRWMKELGGALADSVETGATDIPPQLPWWKELPRNLAFLTLVVGYGFRRLLPPY
ncbi:ADP-ribosylglycohydrolase family protein [Blastopirellula sp. JC732]|uniref:ADP-ribosylglycohydrolase family protein n=1 Tax=Blastopirellula sediminis TaxID=2894196 RepID=A0A9X1ML59_9BACT|nr:ADP-ribosylglycohydrolase family protein [Blastopirellula sediminis]MCC9607679.1 ADP-ribosylglycohydrolase family protein [Blastopirellula sediminis]MCC9629028.1 ADP-ribosylglycohydrolase family protein [Blastopirellula sediminis]